MRSITRIAGILLGAAALGLLVLVAWTPMTTEIADLTDRLRRARCTWVDPLVVSVAGHELSLAATVETTVFTGTGWLHGEEVSGYREATETFGFCLDAVPQAPVPARAVTLAFAPARALAARAGLPVGDVDLLEIAEASMFLPDAPAATGSARVLAVYGRTPDHGWPAMATAGIGADGLRIGAVCRDGRTARWLCDVAVLDVPAGLSYRFVRLPVDDETFDGRPLPASFRAVAAGMRTLAGLLEADALAGR